METAPNTLPQEKLSQQQTGQNLSSTLILRQGLTQQLPTLEVSTYERIILEPSSLSELTQTSLHDIYKALKPDGLLEVNYTTESGDINTLKDLYTIAGFKEESSNGNILVLKKPSWAGKGVAALKKKNAAPTGTVKVNLSDDVAVKANPFTKFSVQAGENKEIIDEDNLLDNEASYNRLGADESCSTKPKACANCSCGRAEQEALEAAGVDVAKNVETGNVASSCGNCYLGDAFRCGSCPYKGLPAFKPGDKVKLDLSKDGLGGVLKEENDVVVANGKVKLNI